MHVDSPVGFRPFLSQLAELVEKGVAVRLIHAKEPGERFRTHFDQFDSLLNNELFERILCPRVHTKAVVVDGRCAFVGSANLTGAGMGAKANERRNFEAGFAFDTVKDIDKLSAWVDALYLGDFCQTCKRIQYCPDPVNEAF